MRFDGDTRPTLAIVRSTASASAPDSTPNGDRIVIGGELIDEAALAIRLGVSRATLQSWRYAGRGPSYIKVGRSIRYRNVDIERFLSENTRRTHVRG